MTAPRVTLTLVLVLREFLAAGGEERYGTQVMRATDIPSGTLYPLLLRLEAEGWLKSRVEDAKPENEGRPLRRYYSLTGDGENWAREMVARAAARLVF